MITKEDVIRVMAAGNLASPRVIWHVEMGSEMECGLRGCGVRENWLETEQKLVVLVRGDVIWL